MTTSEKLDKKIEAIAEKRSRYQSSTGQPDLDKAIGWYLQVGGEYMGDSLKPLLLEMAEALEFVSMPLTNKNPTVEGLIETIGEDTKRAKEALKKFKEFLK